MEPQDANAFAKVLPPKEMFLHDVNYSKFNQLGIPTHDQAGEEIRGLRAIELQRQYAAQEQKYAKVVA